MKKYLLIIFLVFSTINVSYATKIVAFEGLGNFKLMTSLLKDTKEEFKLDYDHYSWKEQKNLQKENEPVIVIGHSFGGEAAIIYAKRFNNVILLITMDARHGSNPVLSFFDFLIPFQSDFKTSKNAINFYRHGLLPGYKVIGSKNHKIIGTHGGIVNHKFVRTEIRKSIQSVLN